MAIFGRKKKSETKATAAPVVKSAGVPSMNLGSGLAHVLKNPRITEKATMNGSFGVYTFDVSDDATKRSILHAVAALYKVTPARVRIVPVPQKQKRSMRTGKSIMQKGGKKAYVYLKKGETITIG